MAADISDDAYVRSMMLQAGNDELWRFDRMMSPAKSHPRVTSLAHCAAIRGASKSDAALVSQAASP